MIARSSDTVYVQNKEDINYLRYLDSLTAYRIGYSVAQNMADTVSRIVGNRSYDAYFLSKFISATDTETHGYFYEFHRNENVKIGQISLMYHGLKNEGKFPWQYLDKQYERLDSVKIQPYGIMRGGELPNIYVYLKPKTTYVFRVMKSFTVINETINFYVTNGGKNKVPYICKYYYIQIDGEHRKLERVEKLNPITKEPLGF